MTTGESVMAKLKLNNEDRINDVVDWFGSDISIETRKDELFVNLRVNEDALVYWAMQYGDIIEVVAPNSTREKIKELYSNEVIYNSMEKYISNFENEKKNFSWSSIVLKYVEFNNLK